MADEREDYYWSKLRDTECFPPEFDRISTELCLNLVFTYSSLESGLTRCLRPAGVSPSAFNLLTILDRQENQCAPLNEIGRLLLMSRANITGLVDGLAKRGLVERVPHPSDRRTKLARLLPAGKALLDQHRPPMFQFHRDFCGNLSPEQREHLGRMLEALRGVRRQPD